MGILLTCTEVPVLTTADVDARWIRAAVDAIEAAPKPVLVHCATGVTAVLAVCCASIPRSATSSDWGREIALVMADLLEGPKPFNLQSQADLLSAVHAYHKLREGDEAAGAK
jgi:hypothetical protein